ncbi:UDP-N-acetylglucosamine 1-carboxyvinyltransferase [Candidatus Dependentiae bacterium]|nr:UDP-N-acetylglucosamine 1-carboxyvinyltransferase [Candidatus Dependentiae bacterium]
MKQTHIVVEQSKPLQGAVGLSGAKNAVLVIMASLILTRGRSTLTNVPASDDVLHMILLLKSLGAEVYFCKDEQFIEVDTTYINKWKVLPEIMKKMRASILVMGPLLARFGKADVALPGGCVIGVRPVDYHVKNFVRMGVEIETKGEFLTAYTKKLLPGRIVLEYPSVGATENVMMAAVRTQGVTKIINAALEPEVLDLITVLKKMGANIVVQAPATIVIEGVQELHSVQHEVLVDRLEAGALLLAAAVTGGTVTISRAPAYAMDVFLMKLQEMGHTVIVGENGVGITLIAIRQPRAVSFKTAPYPGFPTDLQAPMMAAQCLAQGSCIIEETVFENRLVHVRELQKMGAQITVEHNRAIVKGVDELFGACVIATDIRASCAFVLAGLQAKGKTIISGIKHFKRGYDGLERKLRQLGASIELQSNLNDQIVSYQSAATILDRIESK